MIVVKNKNDILAILRNIKPEIQKNFPVERLAIFGSWARGDFTPESDIDILVEVDPSIGLAFVDLAERLETALGKSVDLVSRRAIKPRLWKHIEQDLIDV